MCINYNDFPFSIKLLCTINLQYIYIKKRYHLRCNCFFYITLIYYLSTDSFSLKKLLHAIRACYSIWIWKIMHLYIYTFTFYI